MRKVDKISMHILKNFFYFLLLENKAIKCTSRNSKTIQVLELHFLNDMICREITIYQKGCEYFTMFQSNANLHQT